LIDTLVLKKRLNLLNLAERLTELKHVATPAAASIADLPFCGRDRFRVDQTESGALDV